MFFVIALMIIYLLVAVVVFETQGSTATLCSLVLLRMAILTNTKAAD